MTVLKRYTREFSAGGDLVSADAEVFLDAMIGETNEGNLRDVFLAWDQKGISTSEIYEVARLMRGRCTKVTTIHENFVDIVGTGGSRNKTFNVSTAAAFVVAGAGVPVAKHGNKAATSSSGSADVLSALGVEPAVDAVTAQRCLNEIGICFMFAPNFHKLSPTLAKVRRSLGFPTIFNCVGPLCNPASAPHQLIGVWRSDLVPKIANTLSQLGTRRSWIVHARDGLDEISGGENTFVAKVEDGTVKEFEIGPVDFGSTVNEGATRTVNSASESAALIRGVLDGSLAGTPEEEVVVVNAAAAIYISGGCPDLIAAREAAVESLRSGRASGKLTDLANAVRQ